MAKTGETKTIKVYNKGMRSFVVPDGPSTLVKGKKSQATKTLRAGGELRMEASDAKKLQKAYPGEIKLMTSDEE